MKDVSVAYVVVCPFCHRAGEVTITANGTGPRRVEMEYICPHVDAEYDEDEWGIYVRFSDGESEDRVFLCEDYVIVLRSAWP